MNTQWTIDYAVDAFGTWNTEAETEEQALQKFCKAWDAGEVAPPAEFGEPDPNDVTVEEYETEEDE
jgi:hypothetical protein